MANRGLKRERVFKPQSRYLPSVTYRVYRVERLGGVVGIDGIVSLNDVTTKFRVLIREGYYSREEHHAFISIGPIQYDYRGDACVVNNHIDMLYENIPGVQQPVVSGYMVRVNSDTIIHIKETAVRMLCETIEKAHSMQREIMTRRFREPKVGDKMRVVGSKHPPLTVTGTLSGGYVILANTEGDYWETTLKACNCIIVD